MSMQTVTRAIESDVESDRIYRFLTEASNIPRWAPVFADSIDQVDKTRYRVTKNGEAFGIEVILHPSARAVDYLLEMPEGRRGGAYLRVTPRPLGGSTITFTVPLGPAATEAAVAKIVEQELADIVRLVTSNPEAPGGTGGK